MLGETSRRSRRLGLMYEAGRPLPGETEPMSEDAHTRLQRAILRETLLYPEGEEIRELCHRLVYSRPEDAE